MDDETFWGWALLIVAVALYVYTMACVIKAIA